MGLGCQQRLCWQVSSIFSSSTWKSHEVHMEDFLQMSLSRVALNSTWIYTLHVFISQTGQDFKVHFKIVPLRYYSQGKYKIQTACIKKKSNRKFVFKKTILTDALNFIKIHPSLRAGPETHAVPTASSLLM